MCMFVHVQNLRVRCCGGVEFFTRSAQKVSGSLSQKFLLVDGDRAISGSYRWAVYYTVCCECAWTQCNVVYLKLLQSIFFHFIVAACRNLSANANFWKWGRSSTIIKLHLNTHRLLVRHHCRCSYIFTNISVHRLHPSFHQEVEKNEKLMWSKTIMPCMIWEHKGLL